MARPIKKVLITYHADGCTRTRIHQQGVSTKSILGSRTWSCSSITSQSQKRVNAGAVNLLGLDRFENRAARLMGVRAVIEAASAGGVDYLGKRSSKTAFMTNQGQAAQTRGIRYNAARIRKRHHNACNGCMAAHVIALAHAACRQGLVPQQRVEHGRFPRSRFTQDHAAGTLGNTGADLTQTSPVSRRGHKNANPLAHQILYMTHRIRKLVRIATVRLGKDHHGSRPTIIDQNQRP